MKKNILTVLFAVINLIAFAQTEYDALKLTQTDISGSARYMGMGGAFGALGGDATALKDNPAGLGVFRSSEIATTVNMMVQNTNAIWDGTSFKENINNLKMNNFSYVMASPRWDEKNSGLLCSNFSFTYDRLHNFNRKINAQASLSPYSITDFLAAFSDGYSKEALMESDAQKDPYLNPNNAWLSVLGFQNLLINPLAGNKWASVLNKDEKVSPSSYISESGALNEYGIGWGGNFNNNLYIGANLNMEDLTYYLTSSYGEKFANGGGLNMKTKLVQTGVGFNLKLGVIYLPTNSLRLGVSVHTPTFYSISESSNVDLQTSETSNPYLPLSDYTHDFKVQSAFQAQASAAYLFGKKGLISAEYNFVNYPGMRLGTDNGDDQYFQDYNQSMGKVLKNSQTYKVGAEFKLSPSFALRGGYAIMTAATNPDYKQGKSLILNTANTNTEYFSQYDTKYLTCGFGYREAGWFIDFAYALKTQNEDMYPFQILESKSNVITNVVTPASVKTNTNNILVTLGIKL